MKIIKKNLYILYLWAVFLFYYYNITSSNLFNKNIIILGIIYINIMKNIEYRKGICKSSSIEIVICYRYIALFYT